MTRDEAINKVAGANALVFWSLPHERPNETLHRMKETHRTLVDQLVALGILNLDEPKSDNDKFLQVASRHVGARQLGDLIGAMHNAGLKVVQA